MTLRRAFRAAALLVVAGALGGCMLVSTSGSGTTADCSGIPGGACNEQVQRITAAHGGQVREIAFACRLGRGCSRAQGAGLATVTLVDGTTVTVTWSYVGDQGPLPAPVCVGIPLPLCQATAVELADEIPPSQSIVGITVTCRGVCTAARGETDVVFTLGDGSTTTVGYGWGGP